MHSRTKFIVRSVAGGLAFLAGSHPAAAYRHGHGGGAFYPAERLPELDFGPYAPPLPSLSGNIIVEVVVGPGIGTAHRLEEQRSQVQRLDNQPLGQRLDRIRDVGPYLTACWRPEAQPAAGKGPPQVTLRVGFKRNGALVGPPRVTYSNPPADETTQRAFVAAAVAAFRRCTPLPLTASFGNAVAGVPFAIRLTDTADLPRRR